MFQFQFQFQFTRDVTEKWIRSQLENEKLIDTPSLLDAYAQVKDTCELQTAFLLKMMRKCTSFPWLPSENGTPTAKKFNDIQEKIEEQRRKIQNDGKSYVTPKKGTESFDPRCHLGLTKEQVIKELVADAEEIKKCLTNRGIDKRAVLSSLRTFIDTYIY